ncbi:hypothetical protein BJ322DRAFT_819817 [Thelephora terrestris]|uniref:Uncharacterized protein n=1 Tax=Thelephora terrestris TaxID=56493 RepID=A0A9P6HE21_9AGAM|nr:hypothetical protein BJ322DRAFT_819817 [Thelephora terrestris]
MDTLLVLISLSFHFANAAFDAQPRRFVRRQQITSSLPSPSPSNPTQTSLSSATLSTLPASIQTRIPTHSTSSSGEARTAIPVHPDPGPDNGPIIGFSIGIVALAILFAATAWILFMRYKQRKQQRAVFENVVQLQPTNHHASSTTKKSFDDTQSTASQL